MKHKNNPATTYRCLIAESYRDGNGHEHIGCSCVKAKIAALKAENAKLRAVVDIARHYVRCYNIGDCMAEGNAWIDLQDIVNKMETIDE